ncbi:MAG: outer rane beta-barrel protein, partial [Flaviaesturariibacter sp.]|nr:outer rane beta-barrel protein [Flaviaesturariibacter sp.]
MRCYPIAFQFWRLLAFGLGVLLLPSIVAAQKPRMIESILMDGIDSTAIESATIIVCKYGDTTRQQHLLSNKKGFFAIKAMPDSAMLTIQHGSYMPAHFTLFTGQRLPDTIWLTALMKELQTVTVKAATPAIVVRKDTTEFNIDSFEVRDNDVVADLLRRLPGLEVDEAGKLKFEGKPITKILIDGEEFFSGNPEFSLHKLPANFVSKIQVMDSKSLEQLFGGMGGTGEDKTLNIKLKPGTKAFANASAMGGTRKQLKGDGTFSIIRDKQSISLMTSAASNNRMGASNPTDGPESGSRSIGFNLTQKLGKSSIRGSYGYNDNDNVFDSYRERQQFISADSSFIRKTSSHSESQNLSHRASVNATIWVDTITQLNLDLSFNRSQSSNESVTTSQTFEKGLLKNSGNRSYQSQSANSSLGGSLMLGRRFNSSGRSISFTYSIGASQQGSDGFNKSEDVFFKTSTRDSVLLLDQHLKSNSDAANHSIRLAYTEPISKKTRLQVSAFTAWSSLKSIRTTFNRDSLHQLEIADTAYSNTIVSTNLQQGANLFFMYNTKNLYITTGLNVSSDFSNRGISGKEAFKQQQLRYAPSAKASIGVAKNKTLSIDFNAVSTQPTLDQLQPIPDNTNPLYVRLGNPALKPSFAQNYSLNYSTY